MGYEYIVLRRPAADPHWAQLVTGTLDDCARMIYDDDNDPERQPVAIGAAWREGSKPLEHFLLKLVDQIERNKIEVGKPESGDVLEVIVLGPDNVVERHRWTYRVPAKPMPFLEPFLDELRS